MNYVPYYIDISKEVLIALCAVEELPFLSVVEVSLSLHTHDMSVTFKYRSRFTLS
jgi:hypothetical protein